MQPAQMAYVKLSDDEAVKIKTLNVTDGKVDSDRISDILSTYQARYQRSKDESIRAIDNVLLTPMEVNPSNVPVQDVSHVADGRPKDTLQPSPAIVKFLATDDNKE